MGDLGRTPGITQGCIDRMAHRHVTRGRRAVGGLRGGRSIGCGGGGGDAMKGSFGVARQRGLHDAHGGGCGRQRAFRAGRAAGEGQQQRERQIQHGNGHDAATLRGAVLNAASHYTKRGRRCDPAVSDVRPPVLSLPAQQARERTPALASTTTSSTQLQGLIQLTRWKEYVGFTVPLTVLGALMAVATGGRRT